MMVGACRPTLEENSMLKKAKAEAQGGHKQGGGAKGISKAVLESSHQIWLAGLGAFAKAQQGGKQVFDMLVKQGEVLEAKTRSAAAQTADATREAAKAKAKEMQTMAGGTSAHRHVRPSCDDRMERCRCEHGKVLITHVM